MQSNKQPPTPEALLLARVYRRIFDWLEEDERAAAQKAGNADNVRPPTQQQAAVAD